MSEMFALTEAGRQTLLSGRAAMVAIRERLVKKLVETEALLQSIDQLIMFEIAEANRRREEEREPDNWPDAILRILAQSNGSATTRAIVARLPGTRWEAKFKRSPGTFHNAMVRLRRGGRIVTLRGVNYTPDALARLAAATGPEAEG